jgi:acyl carrier protein
LNSVHELLARLASQDIKLWVDGDRLRCSGPEEQMTAELYAELSARKVELLAFFASTKETESAQIETALPSDRGQDVPLSFGQERIWLLAQMYPNSGVYNISTAFRLIGPLDVDRLERSLDALQRHHEILRTTFSAGQTRVRQEISPPGTFILPFDDLVKDFASLDPAQRDIEVHRLLERGIASPFDLQAGPLWRARLLHIDSEEYVLSLLMHHIIFDGRSRKPFLEELERHYQSEGSDNGKPNDELAVQYGDYARWQHRWIETADAQRQLSYWRGRLNDTVQELWIPTDHARSSATKFHGAHIDFDLPDNLAQELTALSRTQRASLFMTLLAGFYVLLNRYTDQKELIVCSPVAGRDRPEIEHAIGYFNNIILLRTDLNGDPSFGEFINRVRKMVLEAFENQNLPFQMVAEIPGLVRTPLTRGMFALRDASIQTLNLPGITASFVDTRKIAADFDLALYMGLDAGKLNGVIEYNAELFDRRTVGQFVRDFQSILENVVLAPDAAISQLPRFGKALSEIEDLLRKHPQIDEASVVPVPGYPAPVAYVVLNEDNVPTLDAIRADARGSLPNYLVPAAFVPLDVMPLTDDGSIDRLPLLRLASSRRRASGIYVAPRTDLEQKIAEIWRKVLWLDHEVGINDSFIDLGGHSLLSVQLVLELERVLHHKVPAQALAQLSTVAELGKFLEGGVLPEAEPPATTVAARAAGVPRPIADSVYHGLRAYTAVWRGQRVAPESVMVGLNTNGAKQKLFWCLQRYKELTQMAKYLGPEQPVYGMRSGNRVMVKDQENINALALFYVAEILAVQPEGPFLIGGNCQAAEIAFQIARQLGNRGHGITLLLLQEKFIPQEYGGRVALIFGSKSYANPYQFFKNPEFGWKKYYSGVITADLVSGGHGQFHKEPHIQVLVEAIRRRIEDAQKPGAAAADASNTDLQRLPETAYRAQLSAQDEWTVGPGEQLTIPVTVKNLSSEVWRASAKSGIALANRWLDKKGNVVQWLDSRVPLTHDVAPNSFVQLDLTVEVPKKTGHWILDLDLVEEGITWFKDRNSAPTRARIIVRRSSRWWG